MTIRFPFDKSAFLISFIAALFELMVIYQCVDTSNKQKCVASVGKVQHCTEEATPCNLVPMLFKYLCQCLLKACSVASLKNEQLLQLFSSVDKQQVPNRMPTAVYTS